MLSGILYLTTNHAEYTKENGNRKGFKFNINIKTHFSVSE